LLLLLTGTLASAQEFRATVKGQVLDSTQAALPGATVILRNQETNEAATAVTNKSGNYTIPFLRPGLYTLTVEMSGFQTHTRKDMRLQVGQTATVNAQLGVGGVAETVTVAAESPLLETSKADRGTVIDNQRIAELPLQARNPFSLSLLAAGVNYNAQAIYLRPFDNGALADWSMNGGQNRNNEFLLDGAPNNANQGGNNIAYVPPADSVQEFKIATNSYDAQYGRTAGGVVNVSLKSGTNTLHGSGYEFYRRKWLDANSFLLNSRPLKEGQTKAPKVDHYYDQYGFSLDGPVRVPGYDGRNKTFFMFNAEKYREGTPTPLFSTVPTEAMRRGDFSGLVDSQGRQIVIYDPATGRNVNGVWTRDPFPGNTIPENRISPIAKAIMQYYPLPNNVDPSVAPWQRNLAFAEHFAKDVFWNVVGKVDHNFTSKDRVFFRWGENERNEIRNTTAIRSGPSQDGQLPLIRSNRAIVGDWVHIFGGATVFNLRSSYTYYLELSRSDRAVGFDPSTFGWPASLVSQFPAQRLGGLFPRIELDQFVSLSRGISSPRTNRIYTVQPNVSLTRGRHNVRGGLDARYTNVFVDNWGNAGGRVTFNRSFTQREFNRSDELSGNAFASFLLGAANGGEVPVNVFPHYRWTFLAPWIQDDWRVSDRLTLNAGFRWDFNSPVSEAHLNHNYVFDPGIANPVSSRIDQAKFPGYRVAGGLTFVGVDGKPKTPWKYDKNNYQIRVGGTFQLNEKTVLRAGYGKYFMNPTAEAWLQGFSLETPVISSNDGGRTPTYALANPFPAGILQPPGSSLGPLTFLGRGVGFSNPDFVVPNVHQFSIGIQRELPWRIALEASYVGSRTRQEQTNWNGFNEPSLAFVNQCDVTLGGSRSYCDAQLPNPFYGVAGFEGTSRFTSANLSRFELTRPYPAFGGINMTERNDGRIWYDSAQFVANRRWGRGLTVSGTYTYVPRWEEEAGFVDNITMLELRAPYYAHRKHRITASGVWEIPFGKRTGVLGHVLGGWSVAPMFVYQSGQPWDIPDNLEIVGDASLPVEKTGQFIYGVKPCVAQRNNTTGQYALLSFSSAYGCTEPYFLVREPYQRRTTPYRDDRYRRPSYWQVDLNFAKATQIAGRVRMQIRLEVFNLFNSPMYDERQYDRSTSSADFGRINRNTVNQSNFQRFVQLGFRLTF
jgi:hypothetical protein